MICTVMRCHGIKININVISIHVLLVVKLDFYSFLSENLIVTHDKQRIRLQNMDYLIFSTRD